MNRDLGGEMLLQAILEIAQRGRADDFGRVRRRRVPPSFAEPARDHPLRRAHGRALPQDDFGDQALFVMRLQPEQHFGVADGEQVLHDPGLDLLVEIEQPHRVGDRGAALADFLRNVVLAHPEFAGEPRVGLRFLDRVEIGALQILDQRELENLEVGRLPNDERAPRSGRLPWPRASGVRRRSAQSVSCTGLTMSGWMMPRCRMESTSSSSASRCKFPARLERARHDAGEADLLHFFAGPADRASAQGRARR